MAGCGHSYEILNVAAVLAALGRRAEHVTNKQGRDWFTSAPVVKFVTSSRFVARLDREQARETIPLLETDPDRIALLLSKVDRDGDMRLFVPEFLSALGPDLAHVGDWLSALPESNPRMLGKLPRVTVDAAVRLADKWGTTTARQAALRVGNGLTRPEVDGVGGRVWMQLLDADALAAESRMMGHCVHGYTQRLSSGTRIFSLRDRTGRSLVTFEAQTVEGGETRVGQIRAAGNDFPEAALRPDILVLLRHLDASSSSLGETPANGIVHDGSDWTLVSTAAQALEVEGLPALGIGRDLHVMSSRNPDVTLVVMSGGYRWWESIEAASASSIWVNSVTPAHRLPIEEQRLAARAVNAAWRIGEVASSFLVDVPNGLIPWSDTCKQQDFGGHQALVDPHGNIHLVTAEGTAPIFSILKMGKEGYRAAALQNPRKWRVNEVRAIAYMLSAFPGIEFFRGERGDTELRAAGLFRTSVGWIRFQDHVRILPCPWQGPDGPLAWDVTPWFLGLRRVSGRDMNHIAGITLDGKGEVNSIQDSVRVLDPARELEIDREITRIMNELALPCSTGFIPRHAWRRVSSVEFPTHFHDGKAWHLARSKEEFLDIVEDAGPTAPSSPLVAALAFAIADSEDCLPGSMDSLMATILPSWSRQAIVDKNWNDLFLGMRFSRHDSARRRFLDAARLSHRMKASDARACATAASTAIRRVIGTSRKPTAFANTDALHALILGFGARLGKQLLDRACKWSLHHHYLSVTPDTIDYRWIDLAYSLPEGKSRSAIRAFASNAMESMAGFKDADELMDINAAAAWSMARFTGLALERTTSWRMPKVVEAMIARCRTGVDQDGAQWDEPLHGFLEAQRTISDRVSAAAAERQRWDEKIFQQRASHELHRANDGVSRT